MISIGFSTTNSAVSNLVRWFTKSKTSHSFVAFDWMNQKWVIAAEWNGITIVPMSSFSKNNIIVKMYDIPETTMDDLKLLLDNLGVDYDYTGLFGIAFSIIGKWFKKKWHNPWNNAKAMFCSELIVVWLQQLKFKATEGVIPADISPQDLLNLLET